MIKVYEDGSVYVGELKDGKRHGKGELYLLTDLNSGHKFAGTWEDDQLNGWAYEYRDGRVDHAFWEKGKKLGMSATSQRDDIGADFEEKFGKRVYKKRKAIYLGDLYNGEPCGFGMMFYFKNGQIIDKQFGGYLNGYNFRNLDLVPTEREELLI